MGVAALDDHVAGGGDVDAGGVAGVGLHEPDDDGDVIEDGLVDHGDGSLGLEKIDSSSVVVGEDSGLDMEAGVVVDEGDKVLSN